jgi:hypothetical protein
MDVTTIQCGKETRELLKAYRDENEFENYNEALRSLLQHANYE